MPAPGADDVRQLLAQREAAFRALQPLTQEAVAARAEVAALRSELVHANEIIVDQTETLDARRAANTDSQRTLLDEKRALQVRVSQLAASCAAAERQVQQMRELLVSQVSDDTMSVDSWLAPSVGPDASPPSSPAPPRAGHDAAHRTSRPETQLYCTLYQYVGQSEDELSFGPNEIIGMVLLLLYDN